MSNSSSKKRKQVAFANDTDESDADEEATIAASNRDTIQKCFGIDDPSSLRTLDTPSFALPVNEDRYELWTIRLPSAVNLADIHNMTFQVANDDSPSIRQNLFPVGDAKYAFQMGHAVENESFRLLLPSPTNEGSEKLSVTASSTFHKHLNVVLVPPRIDDEVAPSATTEHSQRRRAYAPVPQKTGLKRRWLPFGSAPPDGLAQASATVPPPISIAPVESGVVNIKVKEEEYVEVNGHAVRAPRTISSSAFKIKEEYIHEEAPPLDMDRQSKKAKKAEKKALKKERKHKRIKEEE